jgi:hypothetical protein
MAHPDSRILGALLEKDERRDSYLNAIFRIKSVQAILNHLERRVVALTRMPYFN